jgi:hypothetical protein
LINYLPVFKLTNILKSTIANDTFLNQVEMK